ncbi:MAG TPA: hypothetical protein VMF89_00965 [Polyangiales bacterium]|nr:hypothetical protein [Polyangiales bacterium]
MIARYLGIWALLTLLASGALYAYHALPQRAVPDRDAVRWVDAAFTAARSGVPAPEAPASARAYRAAGPTFVSLYAGGKLRARHVADASLADSVRAGIERFAADEALRALPGYTLPSKIAERVQLRVAVTTASRGLLEWLPWLSSFDLVALRDGAAAHSGERSAYILPDDLLEDGLTDNAVVAPVPDLTFGTSLAAVRKRLGAQLELESTALPLQRLRVEILAEPAGPEKLDRASLEQAAREGVEFVLRHQQRTGRFTYLYDAHRGKEVEGIQYNLARHAGTMFFLARAAVQLRSEQAREGALRGLAFVQENALARCGGDERMCVESRGRVEFGASALTALACAELLQSGDHAQAREVLVGLLAFLRAQQRADGEMMHEYSRERDEPVDVQRMYYSGEAALALLTAYEQLHDARDLQAASRLMTHLTGAGWSFFGARYFYGEEHWTCQAVGKAAAHMQVDSALDFCVRWGNWQKQLQYPREITPWDVAGAFGVGPVLLPRVTTAASRVEALVPIYRVLSVRGADLTGLRGLIEQSLGLLLRMRWAPGPAHLFARPSAARGGMPSTAADLRSRVDMVQHAGSAFLAWADALAQPTAATPQIR